MVLRLRARARYLPPTKHLKLMNIPIRTTKTLSAYRSGQSSLYSTGNAKTPDTLDNKQLWNRSSFQTLFINNRDFVYVISLFSDTEIECVLEMLPSYRLNGIVSKCKIVIMFLYLDYIFTRITCLNYDHRKESPAFTTVRVLKLISFYFRSSDMIYSICIMYTERKVV